MATPSNLYAEKVFSEHPIALWPMDEKLDYVSLISEEMRDISDSNIWEISGGTAEINTTLNCPFDDSICIKIENSSTFQVSAFAENLTRTYLNPELKTVSLGFYAYAETTNIQSIDFGIFFDPPGRPYYETSQELSSLQLVGSYGKWKHYSATFELPEDDEIIIDNISTANGLPAIFQIEDHGLSNNDPIFLKTTGSLPGGIKSNTQYFAIIVDENSFYISNTENGTPIQASSPGFGNHSLVIIKPLGIKINAILTNSNQAILYINGLALGQWAEDSFEYSLGVNPETLDNELFDEGLKGIPIKTYGLQEYDGYYLVKNNKMLAKNKNMPLIFGSNNLTSVTSEGDDGPSLVFPGFGAFNESGKYQTYTIEMWIRISQNTFTPRRFFGPVASTDGLYVNGPFLTLKIGNNFKSHYVGNFYRPMLLDTIIYQNGATLIINGEKVFDMSFLSSEISFPPKNNSNGLDNDWLAFYSNNEIDNIDLDIFAIYPYRVPVSVAKRRFVYGQAVEFPENIVAEYSGKSFIADYPFSDYGKNYIYPDIARWRSGISENVSLRSNVLTPPEYELPSFVFDNKNISEWASAIQSIDSDSIILKPNQSWSNTQGYFFFDSRFLSQINAKGIYGVFEAPLNHSERETLFRLENSLNGNYLDASLLEVSFSVSGIGDDYEMSMTSENHNLRLGDIVRFSGNSENIPINIDQNKEYVVRFVDQNSFKISESIDGELIPTYRPIDYFAIDNPGIVFLENHKLQENDQIKFSSTGQMPGGLNKEIVYYAKPIDSERFYVSTTPIDEFGNGNLIQISSNGTGIRGVKRLFADPIDVLKRSISYYIKYLGPESLIYESPAITTGSIFVAGIDFNLFSSTYGQNISAFLGNINQLKLYVGGRKDFSNQFSGKIYRFGFSNEKNLASLSYLFGSNGTPFVRNQFDGGDLYSEITAIADSGYPYTEYINDILSHKGTYTLLVKKEYGRIFLDIATSSSWEDTVALSYFARKTISDSGRQEYSLNFLQFNCDYPASEIYEDNYVDTSKSSVRTYIAFQYNNAQPLLQTDYTESKLSDQKIVSPGSDWQYKKYEVVDGSIIYLPPNVNFKDISIRFFVDLVSEGIKTTPVRLKRMQLAGRSLNAISPNPIRSRLGARIYPYTRYGFYIDYDDYNPFVIYDDSTPYLYLTQNTGIHVRGDFNESANRGVLMQINEERRNSLSLSAIQLSFRLSSNDIYSDDFSLFEVQSGQSLAGIRVRSIHPDNLRLQIYAVNNNGEEVADIGFYLNGKFSKKPVFEPNEWNMLGLAFANPIRIGGSVGEIRVNGPALVNNISYYSLTGIQEAQRVVDAPDVAEFFEDIYFGISPEQIYQIYTGTNKIISGDNISIRPRKYQYSAYQSTVASSDVVKPV